MAHVQGVGEKKIVGSDQVFACPWSQVKGEAKQDIGGKGEIHGVQCPQTIT